MSRTKVEWEATSHMVAQLVEAGISYDDAWQLRRISMTLQKWFEGECGNSDTCGSWAIVRGHRTRISSLDENGLLKSHSKFTHDDDGAPFLERIAHQGPPRTIYTPIPDREKGARKRLAKIMAKYPSLETYIQGDPRRPAALQPRRPSTGCALYVLQPGDVPEREDATCYYSRGIAAH